MSNEEQALPLAALDLGSNSFHLIVARELDGHVQVIDRHRERVGLGDGLDEHFHLSTEAQARAISALERFAQRIWDIDPNRLRIVATNTLRVATNAEEFIRLAESTLGAPIEVISGQEEARLTWQGVNSDLPTIEGRRLLIDIGGGSTECVIGSAEGIEHANSLQLGCVSMSQALFQDGKLSPKRFAKARKLALAELQTIRETYRRVGWAEAYGSSGTINAIAALLVSQGEQAIRPDGLAKLEASLCKQGSTDALVESGVREDRAKVIPGGLAVLQGVFEGLGITEMKASASALREGVMQDLIGRIHHTDIRQRAIYGLAWRFYVDLAQAKRVEKAAISLLQSQATFNPKEREVNLLRWAASTHEIGLSLSYSGYHKHSAYLARRSDLDGFSESDQVALSFLLLNHRRRFRPEGDEAIVQITKTQSKRLRPVAIVLRLAVLLMRSRKDDAIQGIRLSNLSHDEALLLLPMGWLAQHPLAALDLEEEWRRLNEAGFRFTFEESE